MKRFVNGLTDEDRQLGLVPLSVDDLLGIIWDQFIAVMYVADQKMGSRGNPGQGR
jgi:hypothetical protein